MQALQILPLILQTSFKKLITFQEVLKVAKIKNAGRSLHFNVVQSNAC